MTMTIERGFNPMTDRYVFDFKKCTPSNGWAQFDSEQDASYFGHWVNPFTREIVSYCEGDITRTRCETDAEYVAAILDLCGWCIDRGEKYPAIDGMCDEKIITRFRELGLAEWLH